MNQRILTMNIFLHNQNKSSNNNNKNIQVAIDTINAFNTNGDTRAHRFVGIASIYERDK